MASTWRLALLMALVSGALPAGALAMTVSPTHLEMVSIGSAARGRITVTNTDDQPLAVEAIMHRAILDERGVPKTSVAEDDFLIMPPQAIIPPGGTQNFRVQWLGEPLIDASQTYLLYITQIPVKQPRAKSIVQVVVSIGVMINVAPPEGLPTLRVVDAGIVSDARGNRRPVLTVENVSRIHALFPQASVELSSGSWSQSVPPGVLGERIGIGLVQPGHRRQFILPVELPAYVMSVHASIDFRPKR
jgi:fimbrial chaperone protein